MVYIADIPIHTKDLSITLSSENVDLDIRLLDLNGNCIAGYSCILGSGGTATYNSMEVYFSGDDTSPPVAEQVTIQDVTEDLRLWVRSYGTGFGSCSYSWSKIEPCDQDSTGRTCTCANGYGYTEGFGCCALTNPLCTGIQNLVVKMDKKTTF